MQGYRNTINTSTTFGTLSVTLIALLYNFCTKKCIKKYNSNCNIDWNIFVSLSYTGEW